jgi:hypothetical protein
LQEARTLIDYGLAELVDSEVVLVDGRWVPSWRAPPIRAVPACDSPDVRLDAESIDNLAADHFHEQWRSRRDSERSMCPSPRRWPN